MNDRLKKIETEAKTCIDQADNLQELEMIKIKYLGRKGEITSILRSVGSADAELRPVIGNLTNQVKIRIEELLNQKISMLEDHAFEDSLRQGGLDVTLPGKEFKTGTRHPMRITLDEIKEIFLSMGFRVVGGPEIEWDVYNFDMLNIPKDHPARNQGDTFYITDRLTLRTQTSSIQVRHMLLHKPPIRIVAPGRVYRVDEMDSTHSPMFHQLEGLVIDKGVTLGNLKYTLETFFNALYGDGTKIRFRPHHFQFTEPSAEVDVSCFSCGGKGCGICHQEGWIESLGCGMVHPNVLSMCNINPDEYSGFAFGMGLERMAMHKFKIDSLKHFFENDIRFLNQF
ncbi:MAG: phenylalanine--tRNA ligase subunit alpha [Oscillospiraceae bacterium]|nr:phenylalanine--tRNA ligase subunit alpha [Oscillospiraceae bacterium]